MPGCRRTFAGSDPEIICGKHYRLADKHLRQRATWLRRRYNRTRSHREAERIYRLFDANWARIRRQAIERALGL